jgi:hypothetical protein
VTESHSQQPSWREICHAGSEQAEQAHFRELADRIVGVQRENERKSGSQAARRTFHAKIVIGVDNAELAFPANLPAGLRAGDCTAGARLPATVRLSNASGTIRPDGRPDLRGAALKITLPWRSQARPAHDQLPGLPRPRRRPVRRSRPDRPWPCRPGAARMLAAFGQPGAGVLLEPRGRPVGRYRPRPVPPQPLTGPVGLHLQKFVSEELTPIEDGAVEWKEHDSPFLRVAALTIPAQDLLDAKGQATRDKVDALAFNPWHAPAQFRPLGNLNRARRVVYPASARQWQDGEPD